MLTHVILVVSLGLPQSGTTTSSPTPGALTYRPSIVVQLGVSDLARAIDFYQRVLELEIRERRDDLGFVHVATAVPGLEIGLSEGSPMSGTGAAIVNIGVADVARARATLEARGVTFAGPTQIIPGKVALAAFTDPDGNRLRLAGPPPKQ